MPSLRSILTIFALSAILAVFPLMARNSQEKKPSAKLPWKTDNYSLTAREMPLRDVLQAFSAAQEINVILSETIEGKISGDFRGIRPNEFMESICAMNNLMWYYDGATLYFYRAGEIRSALIDLKFMKASEVTEMMKELGVADERFPLMTTSKDELVMVSGPPRYVELIQDMIAKADALRQMRAVQEIDVRVFPVHHAWAADVELGLTNKVTIPGVATLLTELMERTSTKVKLKDEKDDKEKDADERANETVGNDFQPIIRADSRLNAVIVRDIVTRLPKYEELIASLDMPVQLIEISITILDVNKDDVLDWELELQAKANGKRIGGALATDAETLKTADSLAGLGLSGAMSFLSGDFEFLSSLTAMEEKGKARTISRPSLLTINNMEAELTDTKSYHAKVVGQEVADLKEVSAGITFKVTPRIVSKPGEAKRQVWMMLQIDDGGFDSVVVDDMPMTRSSTLETQTAVNEGQSLLIGGYLRDIVEERKWGIPFLRDIPWIGFLFGGIGKNTSTYQRMFLITPHIVDMNEFGLPEKQAVRLRDTQVEESVQEELRKSDKTREKREEEREKAIEAEKRQDKEDAKKKKQEYKQAQQKEEAEKQAREAAEKAEAERIFAERLEQARQQGFREAQEKARQEEAARIRVRRPAESAPSTGAILPPPAVPALPAKVDLPKVELKPAPAETAPEEKAPEAKPEAIPATSYHPNVKYIIRKPAGRPSDITAPLAPAQETPAKPKAGEAVVIKSMD